MQMLAYRSLYLTVSQNSEFVKTVGPISKIIYIQYPDRQTRDKKVRCWLCGKAYDQILMLILHIELLHQVQVMLLKDIVQKYELINDLLVVKLNQNAQNSKERVRNPFIQEISSEGVSSKPKVTGLYICNKLQERCQRIVKGLISKLQKVLVKKQQVYYHSTDIFRRIEQQSMDEDSEQELGQIEKQLEKLRIEDFTDVNENDKRFFIQWNGYIRECKKKYDIIQTYDMPKLFIEFSGLAPGKNIPRINLVMHAWTLWSVGNIQANDVIKGLEKYDKSAAIIEN